jgi:hypothetical protein
VTDLAKGSLSLSGAKRLDWPLNDVSILVAAVGLTISEAFLQRADEVIE